LRLYADQREPHWIFGVVAASALAHAGEGRFVSEQRNAGKMINQSSTEGRRKRSTLDEARLRQQAIGVKLRQMFDEVVSEPVPDEFLEILRRADSKSGEG
jgi:hypothetical protein